MGTAIPTSVGLFDVGKGLNHEPDELQAVINMDESVPFKQGGMVNVRDNPPPQASSCARCHNVALHATIYLQVQ